MLFSLEIFRVRNDFWDWYKAASDWISNRFFVVSKAVQNCRAQCCSNEKFEILQRYPKNEIQSLGTLFSRCLEAINNKEAKSTDVIGAFYTGCPVEEFYCERFFSGTSRSLTCFTTLGAKVKIWTTENDGKSKDIVSRKSSTIASTAFKSMIF